MRSFIRSHRQSNSVEGHVLIAHNHNNNDNGIEGGPRSAGGRMDKTPMDSTISSILPNNNLETSNEDVYSSPKRPSVSDIKTPPPSINNVHYSSPSRHSPTFESFQKLANKTHKLFKRTSNSNLRSNVDPSLYSASNSTLNFKNGNYEHGYNHKYMTSSSSLPTMDREGGIGLDSIPAIKGTITHSWGNSNKRSSLDSNTNGNVPNLTNYDANLDNPIIHLNSNDNNDNNNDLKPPVTISMKLDKLTKQKVGDYGNSYSINHDNSNKDSNQNLTLKSSKIYNNKDSTEGLNVPKTRNKHSSALQKYRNRQARIHSNEDLIILQKDLEIEDNLCTDEKDISGEQKMVIPSITIQEPIKPEITAIPENEDESENESESSEFSFEYSGLGGRTSSVKYYSKPEEEEDALNVPKVYINDIFEDENFDDDMNYDDDYDFHEFDKKRDLESISPNDSSVDVSKLAEAEAKADHQVSKFSDLFDTYSDEELEPNFNSGSNNIDIEPEIVEIPEPSAKLNNYNDLFDLSDDDYNDIDDKENIVSSTVRLAEGDTYDGKNKTNNSRGKFSTTNNISKNNGNLYNSEFSFENPKTSKNEVPGDNHTNPIYYNKSINEQILSNHKSESKHNTVRNPVQSKQQITSFNDLFDLSDDDDDDNDNDNIKGIVDEKEETISEHEKQHPGLPSNKEALGNQYDPCNNLRINHSKSSEYKNGYKNKIKTKNKNSNNISKFSDLFDISDDDEENYDVDTDEDEDQADDDEAENNGDNGIKGSNKFKDIAVQNPSESNSGSTSKNKYAGNTQGGNNNTYQYLKKNYQPNKKSSLSVTTNFNSQLLSVKPIKKPFIRSYKDFPMMASDYNDDDTENESLTPLTSYLDVASPLNSRQFTPVRNGMMSPTGNQTANTPSPSRTPTSHIIASQPLPPTARSNILKYHDLNSSLDSEVPGLTSTLYFIDEGEEDQYNNEQDKEHVGEQDDVYNYDLDEINKVPEDFEFSEADLIQNKARNLRSNFGSPLSFRRTHSYHGKPTGVTKENTPINNKLEINNKTVTFFDHGWSNNSGNMLEPLNFSGFENRTPPRSPLGSPLKPKDDSLKLFSKPSPDFTSNSQYSLSPIQESTSTTSSPERK